MHSLDKYQWFQRHVKIPIVNQYRCCPRIPLYNIRYYLVFCIVDPSHKLCFLLEMHTYVKYDMKIDLLMFNQLLHWFQSCLLWGDSVNPLPCNLYLTHLLIEWLLPVIIPRVPVNPQYLLNSPGKSYPKLICRPPIIELHFGWQGPDQDFPYNLILWYLFKTVYLL